MSRVGNILILVGIVSITSLYTFNKAYKMGWNEGNSQATSKCRELIDAAKKETEDAFKHNVIVKDKIVEKVIYQDRVIKEKGEVIEKEIIKYVPSNVCSLDAEWVRIHNKAASEM